jgi:hypothetical protein
MVESIVWVVLMAGVVAVRLVTPNWFYRMMERRF